MVCSHFLTERKPKKLYGWLNLEFRSKGKYFQNITKYFIKIKFSFSSDHKVRMELNMENIPPRYLPSILF